MEATRRRPNRGGGTRAAPHWMTLPEGRVVWLPLYLVSILSGVSFLSRDVNAREGWSRGDSDVVFSEIHYHPPQDAKNEEFLELYNRGVHWVDLGGWSFTAGIRFTFPEGTVIEPRGYLVVARNRASLSGRRGVTSIVGDYDGALDDGGEILELRNRVGRIVTWIHYLDGRGDDGALWPESPDGEGSSLELVHPHPDWQRPWYWAGSRVPGGTPGEPNSRFERIDAPPDKDRQSTPPRLRLNEAWLGKPEPFVEILNDGESRASLEGFKLTRHLHGKGGVPLSGTILPGKYLVVKESDVGELPAETSPILFLLRESDLEIVDEIEIPSAAPPRGSAGRYPDGVGRTWVLPKATPGKANEEPPRIPVVINEILYNTEAGNGEEEFVELHNAGKEPIPLDGWELGGGASFSFPDGAKIPTNGFVVIAANPDVLRAKVPASSRDLVFGPLKGKLSNSGETVSVSDTWGNPVDRIRYSDRPPWPQEADGAGFSLELLNPELDNGLCQAWTLGRPGGSPCAKNARFVESMRPVIDGVRHDPPVPRPDDTVVIHAHVIDTGSISQVAVVYREVRSGSTPRKKALSDSGLRDDGAPRDGHYAVKLSRLPAGALIGYYLLARDGSGRVGRAPPQEGLEYYFLVEPRERQIPLGPGGPVYRIVLPPEEWERFQKSPARDSARRLSFRCTFIPSIEGLGVNRREGFVFHDAEIRFRGNNSANPPDGRMSYRLRIAGGAVYDGRDILVLNAFDAYRQKGGGDVLRAGGVPLPDATVIHLKTPAGEDRRYVDVEVVNNEFLDKKLGSSAGDVFRGRRNRGGGFGADLSYHGPDPAPYLDAYERMNRKSDEEIPRLLHLLEVLDLKDDAAYLEKVTEVVDAQEWAMYFAANNALGNTEGGLSLGDPDDYFIAERPDDGRFLLVAWDQDSTFDRVDLPLYPRRLPTTQRFLEHPKFAALYHRSVLELLDGPLSLLSFRQRLAYLEGSFLPQELARLDAFVTGRQRFVREAYPLFEGASLADAKPASGVGWRVFVTGSPGELRLAGVVHPAVAHGVRLDQVLADYDAVRGRWSLARTASDLSQGRNALWVELLGPENDVLALQSLNLERVPSIQRVPATVAVNSRWTAKEGPRLLEGEVTLLSGATLEIGPGVNVVCGPDSILNVRGRLEIRGAPLDPVAFRSADVDHPWRGVRFLKTGTNDLHKPHVLSHARFEGGRVQPRPEVPAGPGEDAFLRIEGSRVEIEDSLVRGILGTPVASLGSWTELRRTAITDSRNGILAVGGRLVAESVELARIHGTGLHAIGLEGRGSKVSRCRLRDVLDHGIIVQGGELELDGTLVSGSAVALAVRGGGNLRATQLTLVGNGTVVLLDRPGGFVEAEPAERGRSRADLDRSVVWPCHEFLRAASGSRLKVTSCVIDPDAHGASGFQADGVIQARPTYVAPAQGDFRLKKSSPGAAKTPTESDWGYPGSVSAPASGA